MTKNEKLWLIQKTLDDLRTVVGADSMILITREQTGLHDSALMLFSSGVETTLVGRGMLGAGLTFFPDLDEITQDEPDGRQRLQ